MDPGSNGHAWNDFVQPFQIESHSARGRLVRLGPLVECVTARHEYPLPVTVILSELLALAAAVSGALKFDGVFSLQAKGDGPIRTLMADITNDGEMRGFAQFDREHFDGADPDGLASVGASVGTELDWVALVRSGRGLSYGISHDFGRSR